ncbi:putative diacylglycerol O-acyltransferase [Dioscorea sansibarensis]
MIEVCMGGKCKKSGALKVMEEFEKKVGIEGAVVGCKCMGKCRDGPNVRLVSHSNKEDDLVRPVTNPLCLGVGLEDVDTIVTNFLVEKDMNLLAA